MRSGSVNTRKQSARFVLVVIVGSNRMRPSFCLADSFVPLWVIVRDRLSCGSPSRSGLYLGKVLCALVRASRAHAAGLVHPSRRSFEHGMHGHSGSLWWSPCPFMFLCLVEMDNRSATVRALCLSMRHLALQLLMGQGSAVGWYQAGSCARSSSVMQIAARFMSYFLATFSILLILLFSVVDLVPRTGVFQHCRKGFVLSSLIVEGGATALMMISVMAAHAGRVGEKFRYNFSQMRSIALFLALRLSRPIPPSSIGFCRVFRAILGEESSSHMKDVILLVRAFSMFSGIPCAWVRNCVCPPITAWIISRRPSRVG